MGLKKDKTGWNHECHNGMGADRTSMNVVLEGLQVQKNTEQVRTTSYSAAADAEKQVSRGYTLDISGTVTDHTAYAGHGRTAEDLMFDAQATEAALQSEYMTVMSNSVSGGDVEKLREEGYRPCDMEMDEVVNTVDRIKVSLARAGIVITGYNDDLDMETLEQITGSKNLALEIQKQFKENDIPVTKQNVDAVMDACSRAKQVKEPGEGTVKYLVENHMEPTLENLYMASYSGSGDHARQSFGYYDQNGLGYYARRAEEFDWEVLKEQMETIIEEAGLPVNDANMQNARFLIVNGIPLTTETINAAAQITQLSFPLNEAQILRAAAISIANGKPAVKADVTAGENLLQQALRIKQETQEITEQAVERTVKAGKPLTIRNLSEAEKSGDAIPGGADTGTVKNAAPDTPADSLLTAKRQLEEIRLIMTVNANLGLLKKGYQIDTTELSQLVEDLKKEEALQNQAMFQTQDVQTSKERADLYEDTRRIIEEFPEYPISIVGRIHIRSDAAAQPDQNTAPDLLPQQDEIRNLSQAVAQAGQQKQQYEEAGERYENFMTKPRKDLGDSLKKAFRNADDLLEELSLEANESNRRAVRILGYNQMEVTPENIARVKDADLLLQRVVDKLTPAATLQMIRDGENPLLMTLEELEAYLTKQEQSEEVSGEKYSKYLYKLEKSGKITQQEKESYIGIYRLFRQVEKSDGAVIGSLINSQAQLSVSGLLSALRTRKKTGMDVRVSNESGTVSEIRKTGTAIDEQIGAAFHRTYEHRLVSDIYDRLDPVLLHYSGSDTDSEPGSLWNGNPDESGRIVKEGSSGDDISLEQLRERLVQAGNEEAVREESEQLDREYYGQQVQEIREIADIDDDAIQELLETGQPVTVHNLLAVQALLHSQGSVFHKLEKQLKGVFEKLPEAFRNQEEAGKAYEELIRRADAFLEEPEDGDIPQQDGMRFHAGEDETAQTEDAYRSYGEVRDVHQMARQLKLVGALAKEEHYVVPVRTDDGLTAIHLTLRHEKAEQGQLSVSMDTSKGRIQADLAVAAGKVYGNINCSEDAARDWMKDVRSGVQDYVDQNMGDPEKTAGTSELYGLAKAFIFAVQSQERNG